MRGTRTRICASLVAAGMLLGAAGTARAAPPDPLPFRANDAGGFRNILPPGQGTTDNGAEIAAFLATGARPRHNDDQLNMYEDLVYASPGLQASGIDDFFKDASFGVRPGDVERNYTPQCLLPTAPSSAACEQVRILRDSGFGVPHIYGSTRSGAMFGAGYVAAEDRLFFIDALRHAGRAELSSFAGGANIEMDREVWRDTPYNESELRRQYEMGDDVYGAEGAQLQEDVRDYVAGINQYIAEARLNPTKMPGEYAAIGRPTGPTNWRVTDVISTASLVAGIFGKGGGREVDSALVLEDARQRFGKRKGKRVWQDFRSANEPEAPTTVRKTKFPYEKVPRKVRGRALPDPGTTDEEEQIVAASGSGGSAASDETLLDGLLAIPQGNSNALLVSARESESGNPLAVMGPQTGYFAPQILMEQDIHAPATADGPPIDARGVAFPGTNLYVQIGRGRDYAWSATSAGQDITDTFALPLCEPGGSAPTLDSDHYLYRGQCLPFEVLERSNSWSPTPADDTPAGSETLRALRTKLGIVTHRATIDGKPHAYTRLRITYFREVDSALGFADYNNPQKISSPQAFQQAACRIDFTFNWFYVDESHIAYFNSGKNPVRARKTDPNFPVHANREWQGFDPDRYGPNGHEEAKLPCGRHPQVVDQSYLTSWNNKQARGYRAADDNWSFQSLHRSQPLDVRIKAATRGGRKMSLVELIQAMEDAGTVDLRGDKALKWALKVIKLRKVTNPALRDAVATLDAWRKSGAHRRDLNQDGVYDDAQAVRIMDAWWPSWVEAQFKPKLGKELFDRIAGIVHLDNQPNNEGEHLGSAYQAGWYGYVQKDLRSVLGKRVRGDYSKEYCGGGKPRRCREALLGSLAKALAADPSTLYEDPVAGEECDGGDSQWCFDAVRHRPLGGITQPFIHWINRPTFQQAVEIP
jgi:hypothetical protein